MLLENGKPDELFVSTRDVRGRRNPAEVSFRECGRTGRRCVSQLVERCTDLAERGAIPLAFDALTVADVAGTNSSGRIASWPAPTTQLVSYRRHEMADNILWPLTSSGNGKSGILAATSGKVKLL